MQKDSDGPAVFEGMSQKFWLIYPDCAPGGA